MPEVQPMSEPEYPDLTDLKKLFGAVGQKFARWVATKAGYAVCAECRAVGDAKTDAFDNWVYRGEDGWCCADCQLATKANSD